MVFSIGEIVSKINQFFLLVTLTGILSLLSSNIHAVSEIEMEDFSLKQNNELQQDENDVLLKKIVDLIQINYNNNIRYYKYNEDLKNEVNDLTNLIKQFAQNCIQDTPLNDRIKSFLIQMLKNINKLNNTDYTDLGNIYQISYIMVGINDALNNLSKEPVMFADKNRIEQISDKLSLVCNKYINTVFCWECTDVNSNGRVEKVMSKNDLFNMALTFKQNILKLPDNYLKSCVNDFYDGITESKHFAVSIYGSCISTTLKTLLQNNIISQDNFTQLYNQLSKIYNGYANLLVFYGIVNINKYKH